MAEVITLPKMYDAMTQAKITKWHKKVGDHISAGDIIAEVETDKATMELESYDEGYLLYCAEGESLMANDVIGIVGEKGEDISSLIKELKVSMKGKPEKNQGFLSSLSKSLSGLINTTPESKTEDINQSQNDFLKGEIRSIRTFIGASDYELSRKFYRELGFSESEISDDMCYFSIGRFGFYLQQYYVKDWVDNSMVFLEVNNAAETYEHLDSLHLPEKYEGVKLTPVKEDTWGRECFLHDPSGVLWHFGEFFD